MAKHFQVDSLSSLLTGLQAYFKAESDMADYYGSAGTGVTTNATFSSGKVNNAMTDNGSQMKAAFGNVLNFTTGAFSVAFWFKGTGNGQNFDYLLSKSNG